VIIEMTDAHLDKVAPKNEHSLQARASGKPYCAHKSMTFCAEDKTIDCKSCGQSLDPFQALNILSSHLWWKANAEEEKIKNEAKRIRTVRKAAIECLVSFNVSSEQYAAIAAKYRAIEKEPKLSMKERREGLEAVCGGGESA
jgi:hypothetical protein